MYDALICNDIFEYYDLKLTKYIKILCYVCLDLIKKLDNKELFAYFK